MTRDEAFYRKLFGGVDFEPLDCWLDCCNCQAKVVTLWSPAKPLPRCRCGMTFLPDELQKAYTRAEKREFNKTRQHFRV